MNLTIMRICYLLAWLSAALAVVNKGMDIAGIHAFANTVTPRGMLIFSGLMFVATIASATYEQTNRSEPKSRSAAA